MLNNKDFYPTPRPLARKMIEKIEGTPTRILEPSAGKGDLLEALDDIYFKGYKQASRIAVIESDPDLQATLRGKRHELIDSNFLTYSGADPFDLIIANPPFEDGDKHLMKALDIMYNGQVIFLLNAETLRNQCTLLRQQLSKRLQEMKADISFIPDAFLDAERTTMVEVALISVKIKNSLDDDLFEGMNDVTEDPDVKVEENKEIAFGKKIEDLVAAYNDLVSLCTQTILDYMKNFDKVRPYLKLGCEASDGYISKYVEDRTAAAQNLVEGILKQIRSDYWRKVLDIEAVHSRMTEKKRNEFNDKIDDQAKMDFTESNIRQFILNLIGSYEQTMIEAVADIFDKMTIRYAWDENLHNGNVHYYNGWKTNDAFKVNHRVVIPIYASYGNSFIDYNGDWKLDYQARSSLHDIDLVMHYFDGALHTVRLAEAIEHYFSMKENKGYSYFFNFKCFKKGTIHLTFKDKEVLRRFNVCAAKHKGWLPQDYGHKPYNQLTHEEKTLVTNFEETVDDYKSAVGKPLFDIPEGQLKIAM